MALDLPASVLSLVEFKPAEDIGLAILRAGLPEIPVGSLISPSPKLPFVLVRRIKPLNGWHGDQRFIDIANLYVDTFTQDPDGDEKGALLSEAIRVIFRNADRDKPNLPGLGTIQRVRMTDEPSRMTDWGNSVGPVQYADLPQGAWRYEAKYRLVVRKPRS